MNSIEFDITKQPLSIEALAEIRRHHADRLAVVRGQEKWFKRAAFGLALLVLMTLLMMWVEEKVSGYDALGILIVGSVTTAFLGPIAFVYSMDHWIRRPRTESNAILSNLVELEHSSLPEECIRFAGWCETDETVGAYQRRLAAMGRKPVVGEYEAAKDWIEGAAARATEQEKADRAKQACARLAVAG